jgi:hypothetical protein
MLTGISKAVRLRLAIFFAALYAVCILAPTAALALTSHCTTEHHAMGGIHAHGNAAHEHHGHGDSSHHHGSGSKHAHQNGAQDDGGDDGALSKCCALMFLTAIAPNPDAPLAPATLHSTALAGLGQSFSGLPPGKLIRPPKLQS